jgi:uncharacterized membrane protein
MQDSSSRVRLDRQNDALRSLENHAGGIEDEVVAIEEEARYRAQVRRGALWGGLVGFALGLMPLVLSTLLGAVAGAVVTRATRLRIDRVSGPRIHFARRMDRTNR